MISDAELNTWIISTLIIFFEQEFELIQSSPKEECINHRFAVCLEKLKPQNASGCMIDVEYDKYENDKKSIGEPSQKQLIRPDIMAHHRGDMNNNLIVFECKKGYLKKWDKEKLAALMSARFRYRSAIGISYMPNKNFFLIYSSLADMRPRRFFKSGDKNLLHANLVHSGEIK